MATIDPKVPISDVQTFDELVSRSLGSKQLNMALLSGFALIALLLSMPRFVLRQVGVGNSSALGTLS